LLIQPESGNTWCGSARPAATAPMGYPPSGRHRAPSWKKECPRARDRHGSARSRAARGGPPCRRRRARDL
jgi:hypothetical protein